MERETEKILENIRSKRLEKKVSLLNLANNVGISHSHLYYIESKRVIPSIDVVVKIAKSLDLGLQDFLE
ncbi:MAG: helix-turn-helix domain-containing protein [Treponema sp.]|jgi:transcriptional regulator with XRE-family HTH domain|nr:helix-turn-helix domain-containing protein [Treponema sp.]